MLSVKFSFANENRRVTVPSMESVQSFDNLSALASSVFEPALKGKMFTFTWIDEDGDEITASSDLDLKTAIEFMQSQSLTTFKFRVVVKGVVPGNPQLQVTPTVIDPSQVHVGVVCDGCGMKPIVGVRYKCSVRDDFDLCEHCEATKPQAYPMYKIYSNASLPLAVPLDYDYVDADLDLEHKVEYSADASAPPEDLSSPTTVSSNDSASSASASANPATAASAGAAPQSFASHVLQRIAEMHRARVERKIHRKETRRAVKHALRHGEPLPPFAPPGLHHLHHGHHHGRHHHHHGRHHGHHDANEEPHHKFHLPFPFHHHGRHHVPPHLLPHPHPHPHPQPDVVPISVAVADASSASPADASLSWRQPPRPTPSPSPSSAAATDAQQQQQQQQPCKPALRFVRDATIPDGLSLPPQTRFRKAWVVRNDGTQPWPALCRLLSSGGDNLCSAEASGSGSEAGGVSLPQLQPGEEAEVGLELSAPQQTGRYVAYFRANTAQGQPFGQRLWADIRVSSDAKPPSEAASAATTSTSNSTTNANANANASEVAQSVWAGVWKAELQLLAQMGFNQDLRVVLPLLQAECGRPCASLSGDGQTARPDAEAMQRVVLQLLALDAQKMSI